jgi:hypothetical protein
MSLPEAAKKLLTSRRRQMANAEIAAALQAGGLVMNSAEPANAKPPSVFLPKVCPSTAFSARAG